MSSKERSAAETERQRALRVESARPAATMPAITASGSRRMRLTACRRDRAQRLDLLGDGRREARHGQRPPRAQRRRIQLRRVDEKADGGARARNPVPHVFRHRQHRLLADERLAHDVGEEAGRRLVGLAGPDADGRQADADAVEKAAARIVGQKQLADRLLRAVAGQRRREELVADQPGNGAPKTAIDDVNTMRGR